MCRTRRSRPVGHWWASLPALAAAVCRRMAVRSTLGYWRNCRATCAVWTSCTVTRTARRSACAATGCAIRPTGSSLRWMMERG
uniref:Putative secreted protein n=1 Tax=Anopheles triannulatus TaxID=58253 RepID=A0A2M4B1J9_9DIPT